MKTETINKIVLNDSNELLLLLDSIGEPMYQYVYREAAGVYWDEKQNCTSMLRAHSLASFLLLLSPFK